jgi:hypothetical protein
MFSVYLKLNVSINNYELKINAYDNVWIKTIVKPKRKRHTTKAINKHGTPILTYIFADIKWNKSEIYNLNRTNSTT